MRHGCMMLGMALLFLLKIIAIMLGLLLFLILIVLFAPIRYKIQLQYQGKLTMTGTVSFLWFVIRIPFSYLDETVEYHFRIFGIDVVKWKEKRRKRKRKKKGKQKTEIETTSREENVSTEKKLIYDEPHSGEKTLEEKVVLTGTGDEEKERENPVSHDESNLNKEAELISDNNRNSFWKRIKRFYFKTKHIYRKGKKIVLGLPRALENFMQTWFRCIEKGNAIFSFLFEENTKNTVCIFWDNVLHLWGKLKPKVLCGTFVFGTGDPCSTGMALGVMAMFYAYYGQGLKIIPDFEEKRMEADLLIKGRLSLITVLIICIHVLFSNEWKQFKQEFDELKEVL